MLTTVAESERTQAALAARGIALLENERASYSQCFRKSGNVFVVQDGLGLRMCFPRIYETRRIYEGARPPIFDES